MKEDIVIDNSRMSEKEFIRLQHRLFNYGFRWMSGNRHIYTRPSHAGFVGVDIVLKKIYLTAFEGWYKKFSIEEFFKLDLSKL